MGPHVERASVPSWYCKLPPVRSEPLNYIPTQLVGPPSCSCGCTVLTHYKSHAPIRVRHTRSHASTEARCPLLLIAPPCPPAPPARSHFGPLEAAPRPPAPQLPDSATWLGVMRGEGSGRQRRVDIKVGPTDCLRWTQQHRVPYSNAGMLYFNDAGGSQGQRDMDVQQAKRCALVGDMIVVITGS